MNIILFGPPGAGKGTQAEKIVKSFNLYKVSTGDLLRQEVEKKTDLGKKIKSILSSGRFVSDDTINNLINNIVSDKKFFNRLIFDGYPRNLSQAKNLELLFKKNNQKISCVLSLDVKREVVLKRILGRETCTKCKLIFNKYFNPASSDNHKCDSNFLEKRSDDNEEAIINRFNDYLEKTLPILNFYKELNLLHQINGMNEIGEIFKQIRTILTSLET